MIEEEVNHEKKKTSRRIEEKKTMLNIKYQFYNDFSQKQLNRGKWKEYR